SFFFFSSRRRHTRSKRDWSSDVCSSDLIEMGMEGEMLQSLYLYEQSLKRCETLYLTTIYPGHGIVVREDCNELFTKRLNSINRKSKRIKAEIIKKDQSASKLAKNH